VPGKKVHGLLDYHHYALRGGMTVAGDILGFQIR
jgi:hypothetical protein